MSGRVYATLAGHAGRIVRAGHSAIVDAVYARAADREAIEEAAAAASVPFLGLWLDAPEPVLTARVEERRHDPSDANAEVVRRQRTDDPGAIDWRRFDASQPAAVVLAGALNHVRERHHAALNDVGDEAV
jgi:predicted kinase